MLRVFKQYYPIRNLFFVIGEGVVIYGSVLIASWIILGKESFIIDPWIYLKILLITVICQICLYYTELYDLKITDSFKELSIRLLQALGFAAILLAIIYFAFPTTIIGTGIFAISIGFVIVLVVSWRLSYTMILNRGLFDQKIILIGSDELAHKIMNEITSRPDCGYKIACIVVERYYQQTIEDAQSPIIWKKNYKGLCELAKHLKIKTAVVAIKEKRGQLPTDELLRCRVDGINVIEGNSFYEMLTGRLIVQQINPSWLIFSDGFQKTRTRRFLKRTIDLILSLVLLVAFLPLIIFLAIIIKIDSKGPVFYSQERVGKKHKNYRVYKFRSMVDEAEKECGPVCAEEDDVRITRVGRLIRKLRIDEMPQLWNVLKGDMSFVGPRPEREFFVKDYLEKIPYYGERFSVKPGITGWAQICYGYGASVEDNLNKLNYDLFYIKNMSTMMDLMIVLKTIKIVLFGKGAR